jgi:hypothetical protein
MIYGQPEPSNLVDLVLRDLVDRVGCHDRIARLGGGEPHGAACPVHGPVDPHSPGAVAVYDVVVPDDLSCEAPELRAESAWCVRWELAIAAPPLRFSRSLCRGPRVCRQWASTGSGTAIALVDHPADGSSLCGWLGRVMARELVFEHCLALFELLFPFGLLLRVRRLTWLPAAVASPVSASNPSPMCREPRPRC